MSGARIVRAGGTAIGALALLFIADRVLQPVPVPAATAVVGGLVALWLDRTVRWSWILTGVVAGSLAGVGIHSYVHLTGQSTRPEEGLAIHLVMDGGVGLVVALSVVVLLVVARKALGRGP